MKRMSVVSAVFLLSLPAVLLAEASEPRSAAHQSYAQTLWNHLTKATDYTKWMQTDGSEELPHTPRRTADAVTYVNRNAQQPDLPEGSVVVTAHQGDSGETRAVTVAMRCHEGYDRRTDDWYWAFFLADGTVVQTSVDTSRHNKPGFVTFEEDGRLWVFTHHSPELADYLAGGELAKHVIRPGAGPAGMTIKGPDAETIDAYLVAKAGFVTKVVDGRLWVFREGSETLKEFEEGGELAKHVIRPGAGPAGMTIKGPDAETIDAYLLGKPGFVTKLVDGRLWVFREGSKTLKEFEEGGELAKHVIRPGAGPAGMTVKGPDAETIDAYLN